MMDDETCPVVTTEKINKKSTVRSEKDNTDPTWLLAFSFGIIAVRVFEKLARTFSPVLVWD